MIRPAWLVALRATAAAVAASILAVQAEAQAPDSAKRPLRVRVAAGTDLGIGDAYLSGGSRLGLVGLEWLHPRAPFSARLDLSYFRRANDYGDPVARGCTGPCRFADSYEMLGLSVDGRYTFFSRATVRPYLLSGFGVYHTTSSVTGNYTCQDFVCQPAPGGRGAYTERSAALGLHSGFGLAVPLRRSELSLELRFLQLASGRRNGYTLPVVLGIRF
jgi:hypothetical protein